jgi:hypothetical protein
VAVPSNSQSTYSRGTGIELATVVVFHKRYMVALNVRVTSKFGETNEISGISTAVVFPSGIIATYG